MQLKGSKTLSEDRQIDCCSIVCYGFKVADYARFLNVVSCCRQTVYRIMSCAATQETMKFRNMKVKTPPLWNLNITLHTTNSNYLLVGKFSFIKSTLS